MFKDSVNIRNAKRNFEEKTGLRLNWEKFEKEYVKDAVELGREGPAYTHEGYFYDFAHQVIETAIEKGSGYNYSLHDLWFIFSEEVMPAYYDHDLTNEIRSYKLASTESGKKNDDLDKSVVLDDGVAVNTEDEKEEKLWAGLAANERYNARAFIDNLGDETQRHYYRNYNELIGEMPSNLVGLNEKKYKDGRITLDSMLSDAKKCAAAPTAKDGELLATYAKALENTNKNRSWGDVFRHPIIHIREKFAIRNLRAIAAKNEAGKTIAELEAPALKDNEYVLERKEAARQLFEGASEIADSINAEREAEENTEKNTKEVAEQKATSAYKASKAMRENREKLPPVDLNEPKASEISESVPDPSVIEKEPAQKL